LRDVLETPMTVGAREISIDVGEAGRVSGLLVSPKDARAIYVVGHGAGVGMKHAFMDAIARGLHDRGIATLRYNFPYMEKGGGRPDVPRIAQATVRAACAAAAREAHGLTLVAGGKSYGGRMTSAAQAARPLEGVRGIAFLGFPLHGPDQPSDTRAEHLFQITLPMLFLQGTRDKLADLTLLEPLVKRLPNATLVTFAGADHSFKVLKSSGRTDADVMLDLLNVLAKWIGGLVG
jgi:predicted alpha/beta-hydrolase family hydrolase